MSFLGYLKPNNGRPDPKGPLSQCLPPQAIALAKSVVAKATSDSGIIASSLPTAASHMHKSL